METTLAIGDLARQSGVKVQTIRYYEQIGLLAPAVRTGGNQRRFRAATAGRLSFIRHARDLGFPLDAVRDLLDLADHPERPCADADRIARNQLDDVSRRIAQLQALQRELSRMVAQCHGGHIADCRVIEILSDHGQCLSDHAPLPREPAGKQSHS